MNSNGPGLIFIGFVAVALIVISLLGRKAQKTLREIPALTSLYRAIGLSVEDGSRLHVSLGFGGLLTPRGGSALAALSALRHIAERTSVSDRPPVATSGDPTTALLSQDTLQAGYTAAGAEELYVPATGRLTGMSQFGFAAGAMPVISNENVSANVMLGHFGPEAALLTDAAERNNIVTIGASDDIAAQSILFAASQDPLIGEELYAVSAYLSNDPVHTASLTTQDILRWVIILILLVAAALELLGVGVI
ncbi:MAG: DUF6754 domain-containing protein [Chloroflexota bacterium]